MNKANLVAEKMVIISKIKMLNRSAGEIRKVFHRERLPLTARLNQINKILSN